MARRDALTRESIVSATREMLRTTDLDRLSLRKLAGVLGVTAPALYAHVRDKDDLLRAVAELGFGELVTRMEAVDAADPLASALVAVDGPLPLYAALSRSVAAALVVWSSCGLFVDEPAAGERWALGHALSGPEAALSFGGRVVVAAARDVDDLDAARLMKHVYRGLTTLDVAEALRAAQLRLRAEHPAGWASHAVWVGGD